ncbi:MAG TPA: SMP-30/gluconolactonase/LRE family protein [Verrucomicrobiae bacterium]|nr:SMP-30/gluconolactonase/LRE family protein [Verrucomicrobiae bacterium]
MNSAPNLLTLLSLLAVLASVAPAQNPTGDEALPKVLVPGEDWQLVGEGFGFTDGACADAEGNFYFSDLPKGVLHRVTPEGRVSAFLENGPQISGLKFGPDGKLYAATQRPKKQIITIMPDTKEITVLADEVAPNDLVVSHQGHAYFTDTGKGRVMAIDPQKKLSVAAEGINAPNGITLSPDQRSLAVSEYKGTNVWLFRVEADGSLSHGTRSMELRTPAGRPDSGGDGSTTDTQGRYYVTSHLGIQVFDATGRLSGVITKPTNKGCVSVAFAGPDHACLYACAADKVFRRKTQAKGALFFQPPKR